MTYPSSEFFSDKWLKHGENHIKNEWLFYNVDLLQPERHCILENE